jgi:hypothetical protein
MPALKTTLKKSVNLLLSEALVQESHTCRGKHSIRAKKIRNGDVTEQRQVRKQVQQAIVDWNAVHDAVGSYADGHAAF